MTELGTDEFVDLTEIGRGGFGVVYRARQPAFRREVAIKVLGAADAEALRRFDRERHALGQVSHHPHIAPVFGSGVTPNGRPYLAMEFMRGGSLADRLERDGKLPWAEVTAIGVKVAGALETAHRAGILHRDLKPANILLSDFGEPRLADFGIAALDEAQQTGTGVITASVAFAAPEVLDGQRPGITADIYSLGATLHTLVTGTPPFWVAGEDSVLPLLFRVLQQTPPDLRAHGVPEPVAAVIRRALAKAPEARHPSAAVFGEALREAQAATGQTVTPLVLPSDRDPAAKPVSASTMDIPMTAESLPLTTGERASAAVPEAAPALVTTEEAPAEPARAAGWRRLVVVAAIVLAVIGGAAVGAVTLLRDGTGDRSTATAPPIDPGDWQTLRPAGTARQQIVATTTAGTVWVSGGLVEDGVTATVEGYEPAINSWKSAPDLPLAVHHHMATTWDGAVVVLGGWSPQGDRLSAITSDQVFILREDGWVALPPLLHPRAAGAAVAVGELIVVTGGQDENGELLATTEVFDGERWQEAAPLPTPREHLTATTDGEVAYFVGGRELSSDANVAALERYDPALDRWESLAAMPTARGGLGTAFAGGRVIAVGGEHPIGVFDEVEAYDPGTDSWEALPPLSVGRHGLGVAALGDQLFAVGGALQPTHAAPTASNEVLQLGAAE